MSKPKYIDADKLAIDLQLYCDELCPYTKAQRDVMCRACLLGSAIDAIEDQPAADVVEVVRCKDCRHYKTMFCKMDIWHKDITLYRADENDYCSYGERIDG